MQTLPTQNSGFFEIARESSDISFEKLSERYLTPEIPVIIEGVGKEWHARECWNEHYLHEKLSQEPSASTASLWYWMDRDSLTEDYTTPDFVNQSLDSPLVFPRTQHLRLWINKKGHVSSWHYDGSLVNVFNVQVKGKKEWVLVSPHTPLDCYPYTNFAIIKGDDDKMLNGKVFTRFVINEGDILYIPPVWFHKVVACDVENINLNWLFTKKETTATSATLKREVERYIINDYLKNHRLKLVRTMLKQFNKHAPGYVKISWRYQELIRTPYNISKTDLFKHIAKEAILLGKTLLHLNKIKAYTKTLSKPKKIQKSLP